MDGDYTENSLNLSDRISRNTENTLDNILQADFSTHFRSTGHSFDAGVKINLRRSHSSSSLDFTSLSHTDDTRYHNSSNILAAYAEYVLPIGKFNIKAGLRYEHTWQNIDYDVDDSQDFSKAYGKFVPSASVSYTLSPASNLGLTYNMRIARPGISYMNPFVDRTNPTSISFGNPYLDVEKTHNFGIAYNIFTPRLIINTRLSDSYTGNGIEQYSYLTDGMLTTTYGNVAERNLVRLDVSAVWMAARNTRIILNGAAGYATLRNHRMDLSNSGCQWNVTAGLQQTLPYDIQASAYLIASSKTYTAQGWNSGFNMLSLNFSKTFLNKRLSVSAGFNTGLSKGGKMEIKNYSDTPEIKNINVTKVPMLSATVGISYTLGSYRPKQRKSVKNVDSDYIEQKSNMESISRTGSDGR